MPLLNTTPSLVMGLVDVKVPETIRTNGALLPGGSGGNSSTGDYDTVYDSDVYYVDNHEAALAYATSSTRHRLFIWTESIGYSIRTKLGEWHDSANNTILDIDEYLVTVGRYAQYNSGTGVTTYKFYSWINAHFSNPAFWGDDYPDYVDPAKGFPPYGLNGHAMVGRFMETVFVLESGTAVSFQNINKRADALDLLGGRATSFEIYFDTHIDPHWIHHLLEEGQRAEGEVASLPNFAVIASRHLTSNSDEAIISVRDWFLMAEHFIGLHKSYTTDAPQIVKDYLDEQEHLTEEEYYKTPMGLLEYELWINLASKNFNGANSNLDSYRKKKHHNNGQGPAVDDGMPLGFVMEWDGHLYNYGIPLGYIYSDGSVINDVRSPMNGQLTLNRNGRASISAGSNGQKTFALSAFNSAGVGSSLLLMNRNQLPNVNIGGWTDNRGAHYPAGSVSVGGEYASRDSGWAGYVAPMIHPSYLGWDNGGNISSSGSLYPHSQHTSSSLRGGSNLYHSHTASFSGNYVGNHQHYVNIYLNGSVTQQTLDITPFSVVVRKIIKIFKLS